jgi:hypothetical protein
MHLIEKAKEGEEAGYVCNTTDLAKYKSRDTYEPYGCITHFDEQGNIVQIMEKDGTAHCPGHMYWEWAKFKSR